MQCVLVITAPPRTSLHFPSTRLDLDSYSCQFDSHPILRKSAANTGRDKLPPVADENEVEDDFMADDDNNVVLPFDDHDPDAVDDSASGSKEEED